MPSKRRLLELEEEDPEFHAALAGFKIAHSKNIEEQLDAMNCNTLKCLGNITTVSADDENLLFFASKQLSNGFSFT